MRTVEEVWADNSTEDFAAIEKRLRQNFEYYTKDKPGGHVLAYRYPTIDGMHYRVLCRDPKGELLLLVPHYLSTYLVLKVLARMLAQHVYKVSIEWSDGKVTFG